MVNDEVKLLKDALCYEEGHPRRTQHILKVYALARLLGEMEGLSEEERQILQAAAILHDIPIKYCKEHYEGDACQENQRREAPRMAREFLENANYAPSYIPRIIDLILKHHIYEGEKEWLLQLLIEADLIINSFENESKVMHHLFVSESGKCILEGMKR